MSVLVSKTPEGWAADCLDCTGNHGGPLDLGHWTVRSEADARAKEHRAEHRAEGLRMDRETLVAQVSWWAGWCSDNERALPQLTQLSGVLLDVKERMRLDREPHIAQTQEGKS